MTSVEQSPASRVLDAAEAIAAAAPKKQGATVFAAQIPWKLIHELRAALHDLYEPPGATPTRPDPGIIERKDRDG